MRAALHERSEHESGGPRLHRFPISCLLCAHATDHRILRKEACPLFVPGMESFFNSLKNELVRHRQFRDQAGAGLAIEEYIDGFGNYSDYTRRPAIAVRRSSNGRRVMLHLPVCDSGATSPGPQRFLHSPMPYYPLP